MFLVAGEESVAYRLAAGVDSIVGTILVAVKGGNAEKSKALIGKGVVEWVSSA